MYYYYDLIDRGISVRFLSDTDISLFTTNSGPNYPLMQFAPSALCLGVQRLGREANHTPPFNAEIMFDALPPLPMHVNGGVLRN